MCRADIVPVTGIKTALGQQSFPVRQNVRDLEGSGPQWDLFIQGLSSFQNVPEEDQLSYFGISGIHGRPYIAWNGVEQVDGAPLDGYCTHSEVLFAIWHRPLVALFEQALAQHIQAIAMQYKGSLADTYRRAADLWRMPYWDWADGQSIPSVFTSSNVTVTGPLGPVTVDNPLLTYRFHQFPLNATLFPSDCDTDYNLYSYPETLRCPDPTTNQSMEWMADGDVGAIGLAQQIYTVYTRLKSFESMSTTACSGNSVENIHNEIHVAVGGLHPMGHFANLGYSGFDPIFMLHHAAIDRHVALWQAVYHNDSMFNSSYVSPVGQFATAPGTRITADSPLKPFYADANGTFHTSNSVRDVATLGYTYPELALAGNWTSREALSRHVRTVVNQLYGNTTKLTMSRRGVELEPKTRLEYYVEVEVEKEGLKLPATLMVWVGDRLAGRVVLLGGPARGIAHGEVTLPDELVNNFVPDTDGGVIPKGLKDNLFWTIADSSGRMLDPRNYAKVVLVVVEVSLLRRVSDFPRYGTPQVLWNVPAREPGNVCEKNKKRSWNKGK